MREAPAPRSIDEIHSGGFSLARWLSACTRYITGFIPAAARHDIVKAARRGSRDQRIVSYNFARPKLARSSFFQ